MFRSIILYLLLKNYDQSKSNSPILLLTLLESQLYNSPWIFQKMGPFLTRLHHVPMVFTLGLVLVLTFATF